ncbi:MAG: heterodisulfide reductase-related iron-sulfur binding cluster, partial [Candidatus Thorarchaeota archaeon]
RPWKQTQRHTFLDELVEVTGVKSVKYKDKYMCCGAGGGVRGSNVPVSIDIAREKMDNMIDAGAMAIVNVCSFCHLQFEMSQGQLNRELGENRYRLPVIYYTQLLGLAMGLDPNMVGLHKHVVDTKPFVDAVVD